MVAPFLTLLFILVGQTELVLDPFVASIRASGIELAQNKSATRSVGEQRSERLLRQTTRVRSTIPDTPPLDSVYPPMSAVATTRWEYIKAQYRWYAKQAPANNNGVRGGGNGEAWRYDPMKTLVEICRRSSLLDDPLPGVCEDARDTVKELALRCFKWVV